MSQPTLIMTVLGQSGNRYPISACGAVYTADLVVPPDHWAAGPPDPLCSNTDLVKVLAYIDQVELRTLADRKENTSA